MTVLNIYLIRPEYKTFKDALAENAQRYTVSVSPSKQGTLFVKQAQEHRPAWAPYLADGLIDPNVLGTVKSTAAVLFIEIRTAIFAVTFGHGRFLLKPDSVEERFGLLVTINSLPADALRSVDKRAIVDDRNSRIQTGQKSAAAAFGIDVERDLIRGLVGYPKDGGIGKRLSGTDALSASIDSKLENLPKILDACLRAYKSKNYQAEFPWIDHIRQLKKSGKVSDQLDGELVKLLRKAWKNNGLDENCWMTIPEIVDWSKIYGFKFTSNKREGISTDVHLPGFVQAFPTSDPTLDFLRTHCAIAVDENERPLEKWPAYRCLQCEIHLDGKQYVLSAGNWFEISKSFDQEIDRFYKSIPTFDEDLPKFKRAHGREDIYNDFLVKNDLDRWSLMDKKIIHVGGTHHKIEFCDAYGKNTLLHVKHYGASNVLGHLFNQGLVSGELLRSHHDIISLVNEKLSPDHKLRLPKSVPRDVTGMKVVFAVISESKKTELHLPFFSKVVLKGVTTRLRELGYDVFIKKIDCDDDIHVKKVPSKKARRTRSPK